MKNLNKVTALVLTMVLTAPVVAPQMATEAKAATVKLSQTEATMNVGQTLKLRLRGTKKTVTWKTTKKSVAAVNQNGKVTAKKEGTATIKAIISNTNAKNKIYKCKVTVEPVTEEPSIDSHITGGWSVAESNEMTDERKAVFEKAMEGLTGVDYEPLAYLGSQVVAGTNHCILCRSTIVYPDAQPGYSLVYIYEDLTGNTEILNITDVTEEFSNTREMLAGGWTTAETIEMTDEVQKAFDKAIEDLDGAVYEPVAYLGSQVVAGMNYCILCKRTVVVPNAEPDYVLFYVNEDLEGNASILNIKDLTMQGSL